jgi:hypothetical protein
MSPSEQGISAPSAPPTTAGSALRKHGLKVILSLFLAAGLAYVLARGGLPLVPPRAAFAHVQTWPVVAYGLSLIVVHWFRAARWRFLLRPVARVPLREVVTVSWIAFGAILLSPLRTGEVVRPFLITKRSKVPFWEATGTIAAERVIDGLVLSLGLFFGLLAGTPLSPLPDHVGALRVHASAVQNGAYTALAIFVTAFVVMAVFFFARAFARRTTHAIVGVVSHKLADRLAGIVERVAAGIGFLPSLKNSVPFLVETLVYWTVNAGGVMLLAWGTGLGGVTFAEAWVIVGCIGIGILVPSGPGYFGTFQLSSYMALAMYFREDVLLGSGAAFVFLLYALQVGTHIALMIVGLVLDRGER